MKQFSYFVEQQDCPDVAALRERGLSHVFDEHDAVVSQALADGPGGRAGVVVARWSAKNTLPPDFPPPAALTWRAIGAGVHIGFDHAALPGPEDLLRGQRRGVKWDLELADGRTWPIGKLVEWDREALAHRPVTKDEQANALARRIYAAGFKGEHWSDLRELLAAVVGVLNFRYHVVWPEVEILGLLGSDPRVWAEICLAGIDGFVMAHQSMEAALRLQEVKRES